MVEDEESKARRNLIAVSTLIVLAWWLEAPLDKISEKLLGMPSVGPEFEWKAWFAALVALAYFALRFRFSVDHAQAVTGLRSEFQMAIERFLKRWLVCEIICFLKWGYRPRVMGTDFQTLVERKITLPDGTPFPIVDIEVVDLMLDREGALGKDSPAELREISGSMRVHITRALGKASDQSRGNGINFELTPRHRRAFKLWVASATTIYSKASTALFVPWALGSAAAVICLFRLVRAW